MDKKETFVNVILSRFSRLKSLRFELPNTQNVDEKGFIQLYKGIGKCVSLKSFEWKSIEVPERSPRLSHLIEKCLNRLKCLTSLRFYEIVPKGTLKNCAVEKGIHWRVPKFNVKSLDLTLSSAGEWANIDIEKDMQIQMMVFAKRFHKLEKMKIRALRRTIDYEYITSSFSTIALIPTLSHVEYDFINCQISDMEIIAFARGLNKTKQIKYFSLKIIQKPGISEDYIEKFASILSKLDNLSNFNVYFRRLGLDPKGIMELGNRINSFENIQCSCSKESIHIFKRIEVEE